jgi:GT2 family glycosyltransferase
VVDLAIVIVNWNGGQLLVRCLESIAASQCSASIDVLVVDNHSVDGSREEATSRFPQFRVIDSGANFGFGRANNLARGLTDSRFVLFLNPDAELREDTVEGVLRCLDAHADVGALGCKMRYPDGELQELGLQWQLNPLTVLAELLFITDSSQRYLRRWLPTVDAGRSGYVEKLYGGFLLVRREVLDEAGWFDERYFMYAEDADLSRTIRALGWKLYYCADATVTHVTGGVTAATPKAFSVLMKAESVNKMIAKYHGRNAAVLHRVAVLVGGLVRLGATKTFLGGPSSKYEQLVLWSLGRRQATVPASPSSGRG